MWPYTDDEARWLGPRAPDPRPVAANDNDPARRVPPRSAAAETLREPDPETEACAGTVPPTPGLSG
jgi:hypothetical protein